MEPSDLAEHLGLTKFEKSYEHLSDECVRLRSILEDLGLLDLATVDLDTSSSDKDIKIDLKSEHSKLELKAQIQMYESLNSKLSQEIEVAEWELNHSKELVSQHSVSTNEIKELKVKISKYEKQLKKSNNSWLLEPQYDLSNIINKIDEVKCLENQKADLEDELKKYCGLKPDIGEANQQLADVKREYEDLMNKIKNRK